MEIRAFQSGDEERVLAFHNEAFPGHAPRSRRHFEWKFLRNPEGRAELALALEGERCVAVYAGLSMRCVLRVVPIIAGLHTDVAVAPHLRRGLAGSRLIIAVGQVYTRAFVTGRQPIEWGFPEPGLQRVVVRHMHVGVLRDVCLLVQRAECVPAEPSDIEVTAVTRVASDVDALWHRCAAETCTATVRDARYLTWRYLEHPDVTHIVLQARTRVWLDQCTTSDPRLRHALDPRQQPRRCSHRRQPE